LDSLGRILAVKLFFNCALAVSLLCAWSIATYLWLGEVMPVAGFLKLRNDHPDLATAVVLGSLTLCLMLSYVFTFLVLRRHGSAENVESE